MTGHGTPGGGAGPAGRVAGARSRVRRARLSAAGPEARFSSVSARVPTAGPVRTCVGCRSPESQSVLLRVVRSDAAAGVVPRLVVDAGRRLPGRGAWLHPDPRCLELAERRRAFPRALRIAGPVDTATVHAWFDAARKNDGAGSEPRA